MTIKKTPLLLVMLALLAMAGSARADVIAATDFDGRTLTTVNIANDTATNLNWTTNGVADPGDMTALRAGTDPQALFDGTTTTQNLFAPALNVGNENTFWTTTVALTALAGSSVTLTDVTFDYWAISASQALNVDRKSDFTVTLYDPSGTEVDSVFIDDAKSGSGVGVPTLVAEFASPIALSDPGTYIVHIKAAEAPETGNHIGIDNLSINGTVPEPASMLLLAIGGLTVTVRRRRTR